MTKFYETDDDEASDRDSGRAVLPTGAKLHVPMMMADGTTKEKSFDAAAHRPGYRTGSASFDEADRQYAKMVERDQRAWEGTGPGHVQDDGSELAVSALVDVTRERGGDAREIAYQQMCRDLADAWKRGDGPAE